MEYDQSYSIDVQAELKAFSTEAECLFHKICGFASAKEKEVYDKLGGSFYQYKGEKEVFPDLWDGRILFDYLSPTTEEEAQFKKIIEFNGINFENIFKRW